MKTIELSGETIEPILELFERKKKVIERKKQLEKEHEELQTEIKFYDIQLRKIIQTELKLNHSENFILQVDPIDKKVNVHVGEMTLDDAIRLNLIPEHLVSNLSPERKAIIEAMIKEMQNPDKEENE
jgi:hypothetical protein